LWDTSHPFWALIIKPVTALNSFRKLSVGLIHRPSPAPAHQAEVYEPKSNWVLDQGGIQPGWRAVDIGQ
jgi:hypothetical protein